MSASSSDLSTVHLKTLKTSKHFSTPCASFEQLFGQSLTIATTKAVAEILLQAKTTSTGPISASARENLIVRLAHVMEVAGTNPTSSMKPDGKVLGAYRDENDPKLFRDPKTFFSSGLQNLSSELRWLTWDDYALVRGLRQTLDGSREAHSSVSHLARRIIDSARANHPGISTTSMAWFFPGYEQKDASLDFAKFFDGLERQIIAHIERNPLYAHVESSKARQVGELPGAEVKKLCNQFGRDGFTLVEDFGHGDAKQPLRTMHRDESVVGIGVYPHETIHVASGINPSMRQVLVHGLGTAFVGVCQALFRDPRMARIVHTDVSDGKTHGIDTIFDELVMLEASETGVYPLFAYKVGKLGIGHSDVAESLELDMANYPSYRQLDELVPKKGEVAKFVNIEADGDAIDFGIAYRAPTGKIYLITANDTDRTILIIAKILGIPLFHQTIGAFQDNTVTMFSRCLQSLGQYDLMVSGAKK